MINDKKSKGKEMYEAHIQYDYNIKEIAEYYGVHFRRSRICLWLNTTVSRAISKDQSLADKSKDQPLVEN